MSGTPIHDMATPHAQNGTTAAMTDPRTLPPGPTEPFDPTQDLAPWLEARRVEYGDIYQASIYGHTVYVISDPAHVQHVLRRNWKNYTKGPAIKRVELLLGRGLMTSEGKLWKIQRRRVQPAFSDQAVGGFTPVIADANAALVERWRQAARIGESVNVTHDISLMVMEIVLRSLFGTDYIRVAPHFAILAEEQVRDLKFAQNFIPLRKVVRELVDERRARGRTGCDILGILMAGREGRTEEVMPAGQLVTEMVTLVVAGHETTAAVLGWVWYLLAKNPDIDERLAKDLQRWDGGNPLNNTDERTGTLAGRVIEETMRLYPPGWLMTRCALADDQFGKFFVPAGTEIFISPYLIQRHPALWQEPERFDPDRFLPEGAKARHPLAMLPFSAGPRNCIGEPLARAEMLMHLVMVGRALRLRIVDERPLSLEFGVNLRNRHDFMMVPEFRTTASPPR